MQKLDLTFRIITPMFIAGADQQCAELRAPSIIGALRFWWRALAWARLPGDDGDAQKTLSDWENALFGSADTGEGLIRLRVRTDGALKQSVITKAPENHWEKSHPKHTTAEKGGTTLGGYDCYRENKSAIFSRKSGAKFYEGGSGLIYLAGQGLTALAKDTDGKKHSRDTRPALLHGQKFQLLIRSRMDDGLTKHPDPDAPAFIEALEAFCLFGGLGSRSRRGFGAVQLEDFNSFKDTDLAASLAPFCNIQSLKKYEDLLKDCALSRPEKGSANWQALPPYSAFSSKTRIALMASGSDKPFKQAIADAHCAAGHALNLFRGKGFGRGSNRTIGGEAALAPQVFKQDSEWFGSVNDEFQKEKKLNPEYANNRQKRQWIHTKKCDVQAKIALRDEKFNPERTAFGMPHGYFSQSQDLNFGFQIGHYLDKGIKQGRRASPLLMTIRKLKNGKIVSIFLFLDAVFLPEGTNVTYSLPDTKLLNLPQKDKITTKAVGQFIDAFKANGVLATRNSFSEYEMSVMEAGQSPDTPAPPETEKRPEPV